MNEKMILHDEENNQICLEQGIETKSNKLRLDLLMIELKEI